MARPKRVSLSIWVGLSATDYFESLMELESSTRRRQYEAAIVDYDLGDMTGVDVAEQLQVILGDLPTVLVSSQHRDRSVPRTWPTVIRGFVRKQAGFHAIFFGGDRVRGRIRSAERTGLSANFLCGLKTKSASLRARRSAEFSVVHRRVRTAVAVGCNLDRRPAGRRKAFALSGKDDE